MRDNFIVALDAEGKARHFSFTAGYLNTLNNNLTAIAGKRCNSGSGVIVDALEYIGAENLWIGTANQESLELVDWEDSGYVGKVIALDFIWEAGDNFITAGLDDNGNLHIGSPE